MKEKSEKNTDRSSNITVDEQAEETALEDQAEPDEEPYQLKTKSLPAILMLTGGAVSSIVTYVNHYSLKDMLIIVLLTLLGFYILGLLLKKMFDSFHMVIKSDSEQETEGEVIEKEHLSETQKAAGK